MSRSLKSYIAGVVTVSAMALLVATLVYPASPAIAFPLPGVGTSTGVATLAGVGFWILLTLVSWALPVKLPFGTHVGVATAPMLAAMYLGGPAVAGWVAMLGTTERRELRGEIPWYGSLANHAGIALPAIVAGVVLQVLPGATAGTLAEFVRAMIASAVFWILNVTLAGSLLALRTNQSLRVVIIGDSRGMALNSLALGPIGWLMSVLYIFQWWTTLLFALPLYTTRQAAARFVEMREMF
ncbi:MAG TPA: hypothetical protein DEV93_07795, partial [Chloroflexi bacterium]|nr:hypothetical protein [Chloroflexota bacterium]